MGMVIHDDMWQAAKQLPEKQRAAFIYAVCRYGFEGVEPKGSPPWLFGFTLIKDRIDMGAKASEKGRAMARARWDKQDAAASSGSTPPADAQAYARAHAQADAAAGAPADAGPMLQHYAEDEVEVGVGETPYIPPFALQCLKALNDELGTAYTHMPEACRHNLERHSGDYTVEQVAGMVRYMRKERGGTKFKNTLTPNTLFSLDHFEQYMHMAQADEGEGADYAVYDR